MFPNSSQTNLINVVLFELPSFPFPPPPHLGVATILKFLWTSEAAASLAASSGRLFHVLPAVLDTLRAGMMVTPLSPWPERPMNRWMVTSSRSNRSSLSKVWLLMAEPGHLRSRRSRSRRLGEEVEVAEAPS